MKKHLKYFLFFLCFSVGISHVVKSDDLTDISFQTANIFQSNMVIQQNKPFSIWGKARPGETVTITVSWNNKPSFARANDKGIWKGEVSVPKAKPRDFTSQSISLKSGGKSIVLNNILIGDVWFASGQSNMQYGLQSLKDGTNEGVPGYEKVISSAKFPAIRLFTEPLDFKAEPGNETKGSWKLCTPDNVANFSAVAYFFSKELHNRLNIPIGIIVSTIGASTAQAWTSREVLASDPVLNKKYLIPYDESPEGKEVITSDFTFEKVGRPTLLYNAMIHPFAGFSIRGFIWYQGESNRFDGRTYTRLLTSMIKGWRNDFGNENLPFYYVQVAPYYWEKDFLNYDYALFREAQTAVRELKKTEMAVILDDGEPKNLHPRNKKPVGIRLAKIALNKTYGLKQEQYLGPQYKKVKIRDKQIEISFKRKTLGSGLNTSDNKPPKNFFTAGADKKFYEAQATIIGNKVVLYSTQVTKPVAVRYAFANAPATNLQNKEGLPAEQFRTDFWE